MALSIPNNDFCVDSQYDFYQHIRLTDQGDLVVALGGTYNPALQPIYDSLNAIWNNTGDILDDTDQLVLNTSDNASETTLNNFLTAFNSTDFATETTLGDVLLKLGEIDGNTDTIESLLSDIITNTSDVSTETTLSQFLTAFNSTDFATETTLSGMSLILTGIDSVLDNILLDTTAIKTQTDKLQFQTNGGLDVNIIGATLSVDIIDDVATETTLQSLLTAFNNEDFATQTTLGQLLTAFNNEDFASETTLGDVLTVLNNLDGNTDTIESLLGDIISNTIDVSTETTLNSLLSAFNNEDFASETTLQSLLTAFNNEDFATQTTLQSLLTAFNNEDFATETTLQLIEDQTSQLTFEGDRLKVDTELGGTISVNLDQDSTFGDTSTQQTINITDVSQVVANADPNRKEVIIINSNDEKVTLSYTSTAVYEQGIILDKKDIFIEDKYRGQLSAICNNNKNSDITIIIITK